MNLPVYFHRHNVSRPCIGHYHKLLRGQISAVKVADIIKSNATHPNGLLKVVVCSALDSVVKIKHPDNVVVLIGACN